jgi:hypothetical protein
VPHRTREDCADATLTAATDPNVAHPTTILRHADRACVFMRVSRASRRK